MSSASIPSHCSDVDKKITKYIAVNPTPNITHDYELTGYIESLATKREKIKLYEKYFSYDYCIMFKYFRVLMFYADHCSDSYLMETCPKLWQLKEDCKIIFYGNFYGWVIEQVLKFTELEREEYRYIYYILKGTHTELNRKKVLVMSHLINTVSNIELQEELYRLYIPPSVFLKLEGVADIAIYIMLNFSEYFVEHTYHTLWICAERLKRYFGTKVLTGVTLQQYRKHFIGMSQATPQIKCECIDPRKTPCYRCWT